MMREGVGRIPPSPVLILIDRHMVRLLLDEAGRREEARGYSRRASRWGRGLTGLPTFLGLLGETAFEIFADRQIPWARARVDMDDRPGGDGGSDFIILGRRLQVKLRTARGNVLLRREDEQGRLLPFPWDCLVQTSCPEVRGADREGVLGAGDLSVTLDGWLSADDCLGAGTFRPARKGSHKNLEVPDDRLKPMSDLVALLRELNAAARGNGGGR